ncbi:MAG: hypothetical protein AAF065_12960 [Verrucomicrobiota bacterium]
MAFIKTISFLVLAISLAALAVLIPVQLRSLDQVALFEASRKSPTIESIITESLDAAHTGPARWIIAASDQANPKHVATIEQLHEARPSLVLSGGPDRFFEEFIEFIPSSRLQGGSKLPLVSLLLPHSDRLIMVDLLARSSNSNVSALLGIRDMKGLLKLHPTSHPAGAPYDSAVLSLALLIEGGHFQPAFASRLGNLASRAARGDAKSIATIEELAVATLSLARQLDYRSLSNLAQFTDSTRTWAEMATLFRAQPDRIPQLYTALHYQETSEPLFTYLAEHGEAADRDIDLALSYGPGSLEHLFSNALPVFQPAAIADTVLSALEPYRPAFFTSLAAQNRTATLYLKLGMLIAAGFAFAFALGAVWRAGSKESGEFSRTAPSIIARNFFISCAVAITLWTLIEPEILKSQDLETDSGPRIEFAVASTLESLQSPVKAMQELNQVTLLVLALFFILQLVIYCFCLIKLKEVSKQSLSASMKLKLLDNEENLFDFGLYVGLGGTVLSLILVAVGIVEASLMAAYASTLFGILFVALVKVLHLRPYRRKLILEAGSSKEVDDEPNLMGNIKL